MRNVLVVIFAAAVAGSHRRGASLLDYGGLTQEEVGRIGDIFTNERVWECFGHDPTTPYIPAFATPLGSVPSAESMCAAINRVIRRLVGNHKPNGDEKYLLIQASWLAKWLIEGNSFERRPIDTSTAARWIWSIHERTEPEFPEPNSDRVQVKNDADAAIQAAIDQVQPGVGVDALESGDVGEVEYGAGMEDMYKLASEFGSIFKKDLVTHCYGSFMADSIDEEFARISHTSPFRTICKALRRGLQFLVAHPGSPADASLRAATRALALFLSLYRRYDHHNPFDEEKLLENSNMFVPIANVIDAIFEQTRSADER